MMTGPSWPAVGLGVAQATDDLVLERLGRTATRMARGDSAADVVADLLVIAADLAGGQRAILCVGAEDLMALTGEGGESQQAELSPRAWLACAGELADELRDWEGTVRPLVSGDSVRLLLPREVGGLAVVEPRLDVMTRSLCLQQLQIVTDLALGEVRRARQLVEAEQRAAALKKTRRRLREQGALLRELAVVDELTGLHNRRFFERRLEYELARFLRYRHPLGLLLIDVDQFSQVNERHGRAVGDDVLRQLGQATQQNQRCVDLVARYSGEQFAVVLPDTDLAGVEIAAERLRKTVETAPLPVGEISEVCLTLSIGACALVGDSWSGDADALFRAADAALYQAKRAGGNRVVLGQP